jgi:hypothetical protein
VRIGRGALSMACRGRFPCTGRTAARHQRRPSTCAIQPCAGTIGLAADHIIGVFMFKRFGIAVAVLLCAGAPAAAQQWDEPSFASPLPADDIGIYAFRPDRGDWGFAGIWRQSGNVNLGVRAGMGGREGARLVLVGAELNAPLRVLGPASPIALSWTAGIGATLNGTTSLRVPVGLSAGLLLPLGDLTLVPYVHPRLAFDLSTFKVGGVEQTDTEFNVPVDVGADLVIGDGLVVRVGYSVGPYRNSVGAGVALRIPRRVAVR